MAQEVALGLAVEIPPQYRRFDYKLAVTKAEIVAVQEKCAAVKVVALDTETSGLDLISDFFAGICVCWEPGHAVYIPVGHAAGGNAHVDDVKEFLAWLATSGKTLVYHNAEFDIERLWRWWQLPFKYENYDDTMAMCYRLDSASTTKLKVNVERYLGYKPLELEDLFGKKKTPQFHQLEVATAVWYAAADPDSTLKLRNLLLPRVLQHYKVQYQMDLRLNPIVARHNCNGILADERYLRESADKYMEMNKATVAEIAEVAGDPKFNVNATAQVRKLLYDQLKLPILGYTDKTHEPSTDKKVLAKLVGRHPVVGKIMLAKSFWKFKGYCDAYADAVRPLDAELYAERGWGYILPSYMHYHVPTNRFACEEPNLQQIPRKREGDEWVDAPAIRAAFKPHPGCFLLESDYSQVEMRVFAGECQAPALMAAFRDGKDVHRAAVAQMKRKPADEVTKEERQSGKTINFGLIFGQTEKGLAETLGCGEEEAADLIQEYFRAIPEAKTWIEKTHQKARVQKGIATKFGHFRPLPDITSSNLHFRLEAERQSVNTVVQGCLQADVRILTSKGYVPIGELYECQERGELHGYKVWTGVRWADFVVLNRGISQLAEIRFLGGVPALRCDVRHEVLTHTMRGGVVYKSLDELVSRQRRVALSKVAEHEIEEEPIGEWLWQGGSHNATSLRFSDTDLEDLWYWVGYWYGDGSGGRDGRFAVAFGKDELAKAEALQEYLAGLGVTATLRRTRGAVGESYQLGFTSKGLSVFWRDVLGCSFGTAETKVVPSRLWRSSLKHRKAFLLGMWDSDGCERWGTIHLNNWGLVQELWLLSRGCGEWVSAHGPATRKCGTSALNRRSGDAVRWAGLHPDYDYAIVDRVVKLAEEQVTYTLSVDDVMHVFDSEGVLSKNTAADILRLALIRMEKYVVPKWAEWAKQLLTTHDSVLWECKEGIDVAAFIADLRMACQIEIKDYPELLIEVKTGYDYQNMQDWKEGDDESEAADVPNPVDTVGKPADVVAEILSVKLVIPDGLDQRKAASFREMMAAVAGGAHQVVVEYAGKVLELPGLYRWTPELCERLDRMGIHEPHAASGSEPAKLDVTFA